MLEKIFENKKRQVLMNILYKYIKKSQIDMFYTLFGLW
jgi:hypothetical protein